MDRETAVQSCSEEVLVGWLYKDALGIKEVLLEHA